MYTHSTLAKLTHTQGEKKKDPKENERRKNSDGEAVENGFVQNAKIQANEDQKQQCFLLMEKLIRKHSKSVNTRFLRSTNSKNFLNHRPNCVVIL